MDNPKSGRSHSRELFITIFKSQLACVASVSVWFRSKERQERDSRFWPREKWNKSEKMKVGGGGGEGFLFSPPPPRSFTYAIFRAVFDSRSSLFVPKPHGNSHSHSHSHRHSSNGVYWHLPGLLSSCHATPEETSSFLLVSIGDQRIETLKARMFST